MIVRGCRKRIEISCGCSELLKGGVDLSSKAFRLSRFFESMDTSKALLANLDWSPYQAGISASAELRFNSVYRKTSELLCGCRTASLAVGVVG